MEVLAINPITADKVAAMYIQVLCRVPNDQFLRAHKPGVSKLFAKRAKFGKAKGVGADYSAFEPLTLTANELINF